VLFRSEQGIKAAVSIRTVLLRINKLRKRKGMVPLPVGIGLDCGLAIVGSMGSRMRMEYTAVGDAVNLAAKMAGVAAGGEILIRRGVQELVKDRTVARQAEAITIKGIVQPVALIDLVGVTAEWQEEVDKCVEKVCATLPGNWC